MLRTEKLNDRATAREKVRANGRSGSQRGEKVAVGRDNREMEREGEREGKLFVPRLPEILFIFNKPHGRSYPHRHFYYPNLPAKFERRRLAHRSSSPVSAVTRRVGGGQVPISSLLTAV